jgi:hypothetical protein
MRRSWGGFNAGAWAQRIVAAPLARATGSLPLAPFTGAVTSLDDLQARPKAWLRHICWLWTCRT